MADENKFSTIEDVVIYTRPGVAEHPPNLDAVDVDRGKIERIADILHRQGYGVMRVVSHRAGKTYHRFEAQWAGDGEPPADPFARARHAG